MAVFFFLVPRLSFRLRLFSGGGRGRGVIGLKYSLPRYGALALLSLPPTPPAHHPRRLPGAKSTAGGHCMNLELAKHSDSRTS